MSKAPDLQQLPKLPDEIIQAALNGELVLFVGAGISRLANLPSWGELARMTLESLRANDLLNYSELSQLGELDAKKQLSIAQLIAEEGKFNLNLASYFQPVVELPKVYRAINEIGCVCVTTNYDELLSPRFDPGKRKEVRETPATPWGVTRIYEKNNLFAKHLDKPGTVVHLHGSISKPEDMVVTTKNYLDHYDHENVKHFLTEMFDKKTILFLGYGLEEVEILEHILRRGETGTTPDRRRFALQGYFHSQAPLYRKLHRYYEHSFGVHVIGFIRDHNDFKEQEGILWQWSSQIQVNEPHLATDIALIDEVLSHG